MLLSVTALFSTSFGRLLNVSVLDETKIGVRPRGSEGNLGGAMFATVFSVVASFLFPLRNCCSRCF